MHYLMKHGLIPQTKNTSTDYLLFLICAWRINNRVLFAIRQILNQLILIISLRSNGMVSIFLATVLELWQTL
jgi:hypothetical protein